MMRSITFAGVLLLGCIGTTVHTNAAVDVDALREKIEANRSGLPEDLEEKPLFAESHAKGEVTIYTDPDMMEACDIADGSSLEINITDATADAVFGQYEYNGGDGSGWISSDVVFDNTGFQKEYRTVRREGFPVYENQYTSKSKSDTEQYTGLIAINKKGKKYQVIYEHNGTYAIGWVNEEDYANTLEYDGRPKALVADGTYKFHSLAKNDGSTSYVQDRFAQKFTLVYYKDDAYYIMDERGRWMSSNQGGKLVWRKTDVPDADGLFFIQRASQGYVVKHVIRGTYLGMEDSGKLHLVPKEDGANTTWRISALQKMVSLTKPMVITQYDPLWCGSPYGTDDISGCVGAAGCGILSPVNAVYALTGQYMDVFDLVDFSVENHYRIIGSGTTDEVFKAIAKKNGANYGFAWDGSSLDIDVLVKKLKKGDVAVSHVDGHYLTVAACSDDGKQFLLLDSNRLPKRETSAFGDWVDISRLQQGTLSSTGYFFYKQFDGKKTPAKQKKKEGTSR